MSSSLWSAFKWSAGLCAGYVAGPLLLELGAATGIDEKALALRLVGAIGLLPILMLSIWLYKRRKPTNTNPPNELTPAAGEIPSTVAPPPSQRAKASPWHYALIALSLFMLLFLFLPDYMSGTLQRQYYLGAAFWVAVIIYCGVKIKRAISNSSS